MIHRCKSTHFFNIIQNFLENFLQISFILCNFASIRFSTSYHNKAICRRTLILRALFGGLYCFSVGAILVNSWSMFSQLPVQFQNYQHPFVPYKKSRRADCLAGTIAVFIMDVMQDALLLSRYFLDKRPTRFPFHSYHI